MSTPGPRTRPGGGSLVSDPADLAREDRELHRLRADVTALLERCDQIDQSFAQHPMLWTSEIRELLGEVQR
jgi:hypothetical protein